MPNADYQRKDLTDLDLMRIYRMKLAADAVSNYYETMSGNVSILESRDHGGMVEALISTVTTLLEYSPSQELRARFFIANVFESIYQTLKLEGIEHTSWVTPAVITAIYDKKEITLNLLEESAQEIGYCAGLFIADNNPCLSSLAAVEQARSGVPVGVDAEYFSLLGVEQLLDAVQEDYAFRVPDLEDADPLVKARVILETIQEFFSEFSLDEILNMEIPREDPSRKG